MDDERILIDAKYEERVRIKHLSMEPSLQGAKAEFVFEKHHIEIVLPKLPPTSNGKVAVPHVEAEADVWNAAGELINVSIYFVSVVIVGLQFELPAAAARHPRINASLYTTNETRDLDAKTAQLYFIGRRAVDYFLRVARWKSGFGLIALDTRSDRATRYGGRLFNLAHGGAFYSAPIGRIAILPKHHRLKAPEWKEIEAALSAGTQPPIWNDFFMSAQQRIDMNDFTAGTIDLAIAAESVIRQFPKLSMHARTKTMSYLFTNWTKLGFPKSAHLPWFTKVRTLFDVRNKILHRGNDGRVDLSFCHDARSAVEQLFATLGS